jgi:hypothetical protein
MSQFTLTIIGCRLNPQKQSLLTQTYSMKVLLAILNLKQQSL